MTDLIQLRFSHTEQTARSICANAAELLETLARLRTSINTLYATGLQGVFLDSLTARLENLTGDLQYLTDGHDFVGRWLLQTTDQFRQLDVELAALFGFNPAQRLAAMLGIALPSNGQNGMVFAAGEVLGASTVSFAGISLNPADYPYSYQQKIVEQINEKLGAIKRWRNNSTYMRQTLQDERAFLAELQTRLHGNVLTQAVDIIANVRDDYERIAAGTEERIARWETLIADADNRSPILEGEIADLSSRLDAPGNPDKWLTFRGGAGHNQGSLAGCTAFVASRVYIPWGDPKNGIAVGSASQWAGNARALSTSHPELGITVDGSPQIGAVAAWNWNHVAQVVKIDPDNPARILIAQADTSMDAQGKYNQEWGTWTNGRESWIDLSSNTYKNAQFIHLPWAEEQWAGIK